MRFRAKPMTLPRRGRHCTANPTIAESSSCLPHKWRGAASVSRSLARNRELRDFRPEAHMFRSAPRTCPSIRWQAEWGTHALRPQGGPAMSEQAVEERRRRASDIVWVVAYSILVLLVMLLWIYVPA